MSFYVNSWRNFAATQLVPRPLFTLHTCSRKKTWLCWELSLVNSLACSRLQDSEESGSKKGAQNLRRGWRETEDCSRRFFSRSLFHCSLALFARPHWPRAWPRLFTHPLRCYKRQIQISDEDWTLVKGNSNHSQICCGTVVDLKRKREKMKKKTK